MERNIKTIADVFALLDDQIHTAKTDFWDGFYADRTRDVPFFARKPDENLVSYLDRGLLAPGCALDIGCGPGRNALHLAARGYEVDAIDLSRTAIDWARERAGDPSPVNFLCANVFEAGLTGPYDLVYDSGCFHHLAPHRRVSYLALLDRVLAPGGYFALTCFTADEGSTRPDADFYRDGNLEGGVGYDPDDLRAVFDDYTEVELRRMTNQPADSLVFGEAFLWAALFRRGESARD